METKNSSPTLTSRLISNGIFPVMLLITLLASLVSTRLYAAPLESFLLFYSDNIQGETGPCG